MLSNSNKNTSLLGLLDKTKSNKSSFTVPNTPPTPYTVGLNIIGDNAIDSVGSINYTSQTTLTTSSPIDPLPIPPVPFNVTANGSSAYIINDQSNPTLSLTEGQTYTFNINASGHPFWIKTVNSTGTGNAYNDGVTNNGAAVGTITFVVPTNSPSTLYYNCQYHASMAGTINVT